MTSKTAAATTIQGLREALITELHLRAWQERASASIGRTSKPRTAEHEHAAKALENLAADMLRLAI